MLDLNWWRRCENERKRRLTSIEANCPVLRQRRAAVSPREWRLHPGTEGLRVLKGRKWNFHFGVDSSICKSVSFSFGIVGASEYSHWLPCWEFPISKCLQMFLICRLPYWSWSFSNLLKHFVIINQFGNKYYFEFFIFSIHVCGTSSLLLKLFEFFPSFAYFKFFCKYLCDLVLYYK